MVRFWFEVLNDNGDLIVVSDICSVSELVERLRAISDFSGVTKFHISISW